MPEPKPQDKVLDESKSAPQMDDMQQALDMEEVGLSPSDLGCLIPKPEPTFLGIPLEIREKIYEYRLACEGSEDTTGETMCDLEFSPLSVSRPRTSPVARQKRMSPVNLLFANRQINEEVQFVLWCQFWIHFHDPVKASFLLKRMEKHTRMKIRHLILDLPLRFMTADEQLIPYFVNPNTLMRLMEVRWLLPNLQSVLFEPVRTRFTAFFPGTDITNTAGQMRPFRDIENVAVHFTFVDWFKTTPTKYSKIVQAASSRPDQTPSSSDATVAVARDPTEKHTLENLVTAVEKAYVLCE